VIGGCLAAGLTVTGIVVASNQQSYDDRTVTVTQRAVSSAAEDDRSRASKERAKKDPGPPPWAPAHGHPHPNAKHHADKAWREAWQALTPAQREKKMSELSRAHAQGMREWAKCVAAAPEATKPDACEKPLPPGLAKRQI
jgi:hypothetical protein